VLWELEEDSTQEIIGGNALDRLDSIGRDEGNVRQSFWNCCIGLARTVTEFGYL